MLFLVLILAVFAPRPRTVRLTRREAVRLELDAIDADGDWR